MMVEWYASREVVDFECRKEVAKEALLDRKRAFPFRVYGRT
jgi:hypothetical protein